MLKNIMLVWLITLGIMSCVATIYGLSNLFKASEGLVLLIAMLTIPSYITIFSLIGSKIYERLDE